MSSKLLRSSAVVIVMGATFVGSLLLLLSGAADGQVLEKVKVIGKAVPAGPAAPKGVNPDDPNSVGEFGSVTLPTEKNAKGKIEAARDYINQAEPDWPKAIH